MLFLEICICVYSLSFRLDQIVVDIYVIAPKHLSKIWS